MHEVRLPLQQVCSLHFSHARRLADEVGAQAVASIEALSPAALCLVAVHDTAIAEVGRQLKPEQGLAAHTSGGQSLQVLQAVYPRCGVFYPMQSFSTGIRPDWERIPIFTETTQPDDLPMLEQLGRAMGAATYPLASEQRQYLHLGAVFVNNFSNHMMHLAARSTAPLQERGIPFSVFQGLAEETVRKVFALGPEAAQTGPAVRGDEAVINKHIKLLASDPDAQALYRTLTEAIRAHHTPDPRA